MKRCATIIVGLVVAVGCANFAEVGGAKVPLVFHSKTFQ
jgi:hypothetical protein